MVKNYLNQDINRFCKESNKIKNINKNIINQIDMNKYIDVEFIIDMYEKNKFCPNSNCAFSFMSFEKSNVNKVTVDRINNNMPHYKENCILMCKICNVYKSNKNQ